MEEVRTIKERQAHERLVFEKEVRRARKDAFKAGSNLVKTQEDLKEARAETTTLKAEVDNERSAKEQAKQEAFERAYTLAGILEEMEVMRDTLRSVEAERDAVLLERQATVVQTQEQHLDRKHENDIEEEVPQSSVARIEQDTFFGQAQTSDADGNFPDRSPLPRRRKNRFERLLPVNSPESTPLIKFCNKFGPRAHSKTFLEAERDYLMGAGEPDLEDQLMDLQAELRWEKTLRERADDMVHFLQMECQFRMCACRIAEQSGTRFIHDWDYENKQRAESAERKQRAQSAEGEKHVGHAAESKAARAVSSAREREQSRRPTSKPHHGKMVPGAKSFAVISHQDRPLSAAANFHSSAPILRPDQKAQSTRDRLKLSPPKPQSPRPSTAMGIVTLQSPIRVVPHSPLPSSSTPAKDSWLNTSNGRLTSTPRSTRTGSPSASPYPMTPVLKTPIRPVPRTIQTTTTLVPLRGLEDDDVFSPASQNVPGTPVSREAALAQIRARRDRARSINLKTNSCRSAPGSAKRGLGGGVREFSAPGRF